MKVMPIVSLIIVTVFMITIVSTVTEEFANSTIFYEPSGSSNLTNDSQKVLNEFLSIIPLILTLFIAMIILGIVCSMIMPFRDLIEDPIIEDDGEEDDEDDFGDSEDYSGEMLDINEEDKEPLIKEKHTPQVINKNKEGWWSRFIDSLRRK